MAWHLGPHTTLACLRQECGSADCVLHLWGRCGHTLTAIAGPDGDLSSAKLILFGEQALRCAPVLLLVN